VCVAQ